MRIQVEISVQTRVPGLSQARLRRIVREVLKSEGVHDAEIGVALVSDATIADLHHRHMGIEGSTDVLTFPLSETRDPPLEGEIVLSVDTARAVAERLGHEAADEAALYVIHGLLHLCGYDDRTPSQRRKMRARERYHLQRLGIGVQR